MANINDVAKHAGVSIATVSRYFSHPEKLSQASLARVKKAIDELNYRPNMLARNLLKSQSKTVMILAGSITNSFIADIIHHADRAAHQRGYSVILGNTNFSEEIESQYLERIHSKMADGFLQLSANVHSTMLDDKARIPFVNLLECLPCAKYPTVQIDNHQAAKKITGHLLDLGHTRLASLAGIYSAEYPSPVTVDRIKGFNDALLERHISPNTEWALQGDYTLQSGWLAAQKILQMKHRPTAVFCCNDYMAIGLIKGLKEGGLSVPEDVSVTGFDDIAIASFIDPPLTTISQPIETLGCEAMDMLINMLEGKHIDQRHLRPPFSLVVRASTSKPPSPTRLL